MTNYLQVTIPAKPELHYPITISAELLRNWQDWLPSYAPTRKLVIISDNLVGEIYGEKFASELTLAGYSVKLLAFPHGETSKSAATKLGLEEQMFAFGCDRHTLCIALGGGVVGDLAGFTAATYMRGMNYIQVPTSLLAMIDSSVGGKTAVNTSYGKNIIGAFWQPRAVIMDINLLQTLPAEHVRNGFFEAVKIFLSLDYEMFAYCEQELAAILSLEPVQLTNVIRRAVELKAQVVEIDEQERNLRMILNFGHTVAHAIEKLSNYQILHGYAVGVGMLVEAKIAQHAGLLSADDFKRLADFLQALDVTPALLNKYSPAELINAMRGDKKNRNQEIVMVLLTGIGQVKNINNQVAFPVQEDLIAMAITQLLNN